MAEVDRLVDELRWDESSADRPVVLVGDRPVASFEHRDHRVLTWLELLNGQRRVDVTVQPDTVVFLIRSLAARRRRDGNAWERALARRLGTVAADWGVESGGPICDTLAPVIASLGFPLVGLARSHGLMAPPFVPRWAEQILAAPNIRAAATSAFGDKANRRVVRVLPTSLLGSPEGPFREHRTLTLLPLAFALALPDDCSADVIANVLTTTAADHASQHWPDLDELELLRRGFDLLGARTAASLATEALGSLRGPRRLIGLMVHAPRLLSVHDGPLPRRIDDLDTDITELLDGAGPVPVPAPDAMRAEAAPRAYRAVDRVAAHQPARGVDLPAIPLNPPPLGAINRAEQTEPAGEEFNYPDRVQRLHGATVGLHSLCLPCSRTQLQAWGRDLENCMVDYCDHVAGNRSVILGLRRRGRLVAGVELSADLTTVRQFVRDHNQPPRRPECDALRVLLARLGVAGG